MFTAGKYVRVAKMKVSVAQSRNPLTKNKDKDLTQGNILSKHQAFLDYIFQQCNQDECHVADTTGYTNNPTNKEWIKENGRMPVVMRTGISFPMVLIPLASTTTEGTTIAIMWIKRHVSWSNLILLCTMKSPAARPY